MAAVVIRPLVTDDLPILVGVLSRAYKSEQNFAVRLVAYLQSRRVATFVAESEGVPVGMVVGNDYGCSAYVSQMAVDPVVQRRGIGTQLMNGLIDWVDERSFVVTELDATRAGRPLYGRYGFVETGRTDVYGSTANVGAESSARAYRPSDRAALLSVDAAAFGADRSEVLGALIDLAPEHVVVAGSANGLDGYAIAQPSSKLLGPVIAMNRALAEQLIDAARAHLRAGHRISVPSANAAIAAILAARGYHVLRSLAHMVRGASPAARRDRIFARINLGQG